jgi:predicted ATPase
VRQHYDVTIAEPVNPAYLLHLLGVRSAVDTLSGTSPGTLKAHTFAASKQLWIKSSQRRLLVVAVEDLHWIDPTSEEFVTMLVDALPGAAVLLLATYRPGYRTPWVEKSYTTQLSLPPLSATDSAHVVQALLHQETAPSPLADAVLAKAQGNPLFLEELARMLVQRQIPADAPSDPSGALPQSIESHLPPNVEAVIAARIDRLSIEAKRLLQTAAVVGVDVPISLLRLVAGSTESAFDAHLAELQAAELLNENHRLRDAAYTFKHALTQEVAYSSLLRHHRSPKAGASRAVQGDRTVPRDGDEPVARCGHGSTGAHTMMRLFRRRARSRSSTRR